MFCFPKNLKLHSWNNMEQNILKYLQQRANQNTVDNYSRQINSSFL